MSDLSPMMALLVSIALVALSAFFVAIEFALVAARRNRLEEAAAQSLAARVALKSSRDLTLLLAGSQLGITLCTLALGAVAEPAVEHLLLPIIPSEVASFILALVVVTFLHLVVGEMAPKSWAIAHPERSATLLAIPMRAFMWVTRPVLIVLNGMANGVLRLIGIEPVDEVSQGRRPEDLRELVDHSARAGALDPKRRDQLATALEVNARPLREVITPALAGVRPDTDVAGIKQASLESGHFRLVVRDGDRAIGVVHVRDALTRPPSTTAAELMRPLLTLRAATPIYAALSVMRESRNHLVLVEDGEELIGLVTMKDLLNELLPA